MLSYQHLYHAGNLADVHKHALLAWMLAYLTRKDKPLTYVETHAGRGLYGLSAPEAVKTGEAAQGIARVAGWFAADDPYARVLSELRERLGSDAYPGSPLIASSLLRPGDRIHLAELHPQERAALVHAMQGRIGVRIHAEDGFALAQSILPPEPRRGLMLVDPSYEVKAEYDDIPGWLEKIHAKWNVGVLVLWYPILPDGRHRVMQFELLRRFPEALCSEVAFPQAVPGKGMQGFGLVVVNPPWGLDEAARDLAVKFRGL